MLQLHVHVVEVVSDGVEGLGGDGRAVGVGLRAGRGAGEARAERA